MINADAMFHRYKQLRGKGYSAKSAARAAIRPQERPAVDWTDGVAHLEIGPYSVKVEQKYDPDPDLSWLGEYSDRPDVDAVTRSNAGRNECRYWNPTIILAEHYQAFHRLGYCKADAWLKALECREQNFNHMERYCRGDWAMLDIVATARIGDMVCGGATLGGVESDSGDYIDEIAHELAHAAVMDAAAVRDAMICKRAEEIAALASTPCDNV